MSASCTREDMRWLGAAARLALPFRGTTADNPTVGALVVSPDGIVLGQGVTARGGRPHAEPQALAMAGEKAAGATLYVTLEPCNHWGKTPPCVDAVIRSGLTRVVCGSLDPDPRTAGQSVEKLKQAGIAVAIAAYHADVQLLHEGFFKRMVEGRPFVTAKLAVSSDGMIGLPDKGNVPITGDAARRWTHMQRAVSDAVMVGGGTARLDKPRLTVRLPGLEDRTPLRVIVMGQGAMNHFAGFEGENTVFLSESRVLESLSERVESETEPGRANLRAGLENLARRGISSVLVEGGATLNDVLLDEGLIDRFHLLESDVEIGPTGVRATVHSSLPERLQELGYIVVDRRALGCDRLITFERVH